MTSSELRALFEPKSVVLLGASDLAGKEATSATFFHALASNLSKFKGKVHGVDLNGKLEGYKKKITNVPAGCDLAVVALPKDALAKNLSNLLAKRTKAMVLISDGLGQKQLEGLANLTKKGRLLLLGPKATMGIINTSNGFVATPEQGLTPKRGHIAVISQDGGLAAVMLDWACSHGVGLSKFACVGDGLGISMADLVRYLAQDKETKAICVYLETVKEGRNLVEAIGEATKSKPVLVLTGGSEHERILEAALKQAGAFQAQGVEDIFAVADGLAKQQSMCGDRVAVITNVAGPAKLFVRFLTQEGLTLTEPSTEITKKISKKHPNVNISGFIDLGVEAKADLYKFVLEQVLSDKVVDGVMVINAIKSTFLKPDEIRKVAEAAKKSKGKPVIDLAPGGEDNSRVRERLADTEVPVYDQPEKAARAMKLLSMRGKMLEKVKQK